MIDLKLLRENPQRIIEGAKAKNITVDISTLLELDEQRRLLQRQKEDHRAEQNRISKEIGPQIGKLKGQLKSASDDEKNQIKIYTFEVVTNNVVFLNTRNNSQTQNSSDLSYDDNSLFKNNLKKEIEKSDNEDDKMTFAEDIN